MPRILALISLGVFVIGTAFAAQKKSHLTTTSPTASVTGRVTVHITVGRTTGEHPVAKLQLYLLRVEDSNALQELQRKCRRAVAQARSEDPVAAYDVCIASLAEAAKLVPQMAAAATVQTDREGHYKFENIPAGRRYQVVGVKYEGNEPTLVVGLTPRLKPGEHCRINLSENAAWTDALPGKE